MDKQEELFVVVDKSDHIIDYRSRSECNHDKNLIHRAVYVVLFNNKGQILLQKRSKHKDTSPGFYTASASGHVSRGESYEAAAKRELFEELGIQIDLTYVTKFIQHWATETEMTAIFTGRHNGPFKIHPKEVEEVEFFTPKEIKRRKDKLTSATIYVRYSI